MNKAKQILLLAAMVLLPVGAMAQTTIDDAVAKMKSGFSDKVGYSQNTNKNKVNDSITIFTDELNFKIPTEEAQALESVKGAFAREAASAVSDSTSTTSEGHNLRVLNFRDASRASFHTIYSLEFWKEKGKRKNQEFVVGVYRKKYSK